jgi:hypothetical protein
MLWRAVAAVVAAVGVAGCGTGTELLMKSSISRSAPTPPVRPVPSAQSSYLAQIGAAQSQLAIAEQRIPVNPRTPAALVRSVDLLAAAVHRLADGLAAIKPPLTVAGRHAQLVAIIRRYDVRLREAARMAGTRGGEGRAGALLISATSRASRSFAATIAVIDSTLASSPS